MPQHSLRPRLPPPRPTLQAAARPLRLSVALIVLPLSAAAAQPPESRGPPRGASEARGAGAAPPPPAPPPATQRPTNVTRSAAPLSPTAAPTLVRRRSPPPAPAAAPSPPPAAPPPLPPKPPAAPHPAPGPPSGTSRGARPTAAPTGRQVRRATAGPLPAPHPPASPRAEAPPAARVQPAAPGTRSSSNASSSNSSNSTRSPTPASVPPLSGRAARASSAPLAPGNASRAASLTLPAAASPPPSRGRGELPEWAGGPAAAERVAEELRRSRETVAQQGAALERFRALADRLEQELRRRRSAAAQPAPEEGAAGAEDCGGWGAIGSDPAALAAALPTLPAACLRRLPPGRLAALSSQQLAAMRPEVLGALRADQLQRIAERDCGTVAAALPMLRGEQCSVLPVGCGGALSEELLRAVRWDCFTHLPPALAGALDPEQLAAVPAVAWLGATRGLLAALSPLQCAALGPAAAAGLRACGGLSALCLRSMRPAALGALKPRCTRRLEGAALRGLGGAAYAFRQEVLAALAPAQLAELGHECDAFEPPALSSLTAAQCGALPPACAAALRHAGALSASCAAALPPEAVGALGTRHLRALRADAVAALRPEQVARLSGRACAALAPTQTRGLGGPSCRQLRRACAQTAQPRALAACDEAAPPTAAAPPAQGLPPALAEQSSQAARPDAPEGPTPGGGGAGARSEDAAPTPLVSHQAGEPPPDEEKTAAPAAAARGHESRRRRRFGGGVRRAPPVDEAPAGGDFTPQPHRARSSALVGAGLRVLVERAVQDAVGGALADVAQGASRYGPATPQPPRGAATGKGAAQWSESVYQGAPDRGAEAPAGEASNAVSFSDTAGEQCEFHLNRAGVLWYVGPGGARRRVDRIVYRPLARQLEAAGYRMSFPAEKDSPSEGLPELLNNLGALADKAGVPHNLGDAVSFVDTEGDAGQFCVSDGAMWYTPLQGTRSRVRELKWLPWTQTLEAAGWRMGIAERGAALHKLLSRIAAIADKAGVKHTLSDTVALTDADGDLSTFTVDAHALWYAPPRQQGPLRVAKLKWDAKARELDAAGWRMKVPLTGKPLRELLRRLARLADKAGVWQNLHGLVEFTAADGELAQFRVIDGSLFCVPSPQESRVRVERVRWLPLKGELEAAGWRIGVTAADRQSVLDQVARLAERVGVPHNIAKAGAAAAAPAAPRAAAVPSAGAARAAALKPQGAAAAAGAAAGSAQEPPPVEELLARPWQELEKAYPLFRPNDAMKRDWGPKAPQQLRAFLAARRQQGDFSVHIPQKGAAPAALAAPSAPSQQQLLAAVRAGRAELAQLRALRAPTPQQRQRLLDLQPQLERMQELLLRTAPQPAAAPGAPTQRPVTAQQQALLDQLHQLQQLAARQPLTPRQRQQMLVLQYQLRRLGAQGDLNSPWPGIIVVAVTIGAVIAVLSMRRGGR
eukprot:TRINITY_DN17138_c0_g1_i3.p1 TRINITY_DN17138_c0_g1~~TRINITY_DN17138_c0_g1_i3.p1  ORF type:complete len:1457 (+),score=453.53 TRINITY_DN17138_c0_g1_i3:60-4373(+)